jgi:hypothetical protein
MSAQLRLTLYAALATMTTATALISVFKGSAWVIPVMVAIALVGAGCAAVRSSALPSAFEPIVAALLVLFWIAFLDARSSSHLGFIPARTGFRHLDHTARNGFTEIHKLPTPAPAHHGLVMLTVIGVAAVALVVDLLVVTLRRAALSGLPLLAMFTVCAATGHHGVGLVPFILAAVGYLWLLYADNREKVARWGAAVGTGSKARPASTWSTDASGAPPPASLGRRVGATAISLGVVVPLLIPGLHTGIDKHGTGPGGHGSASNTTVVANPIVSVASDLTSARIAPVLTYRTSTPDPSYLRMTSLDQFDGTTFSAAPLKESSKAAAGESLPVAPPGPLASAANPVVNTTVSVLPRIDLNYLPAPITVVGTSVGNSWRYSPSTATIFSSATTTSGIGYTTRSIADDPTVAELNSAGRPNGTMAADIAIPRGKISPQVIALTRRVTANATTEFQAAIDIQNFFTSGHFTYNTHVPADTSGAALTHFLIDTKTGFCQQFATAMAAMARIDGIPARVAVGFTAGKKGTNGVYQVTTHDAHAWPELYFQGYGWLAFEPTPRADGQAVKPAYAQATQGNKTGTKPPSTNPASPPPPNNRILENFHPRPGIGATGDGSGGQTVPPLGSAAHHGRGLAGRVGLVIGVAVLLLLAFALPGVSRVRKRRHRWRVLARQPDAAGGVAWAELRDTALDLHVDWDDGHTPRQISAALAIRVGPTAQVRAALQHLARSEERSRYAAAVGSADPDARHDVELVTAAIAATATRSQRLRAAVMPASTLSVVRAVGRGVGALVDGIDRVGGYIGRALTFRSRLRTNP